MHHTAFERAWEAPVAKMKNPWLWVAAIAALVVWRGRYIAQATSSVRAGAVRQDITGTTPVLDSSDGPSTITDPNSSGFPIDWSTPATHPSFGPVYGIADPIQGGYITIGDCSKGPC